MKTKEIIRAEIMAGLGNDEPMPTFSLIETHICMAIDRLRGIPVKQPRIDPHEQQRIDKIMGAE